MTYGQLRNRHLLPLTLLFLAGGCETPWYAAEPVVDTLIPSTNPPAYEKSRSDVVQKIGEPCEVPDFGDQAEYMGDADGYRFIHVRDMFDYFGFLGEPVYKIPASQWPMSHPMPLTYDATKWRDVAWMGSDAPDGVVQSVFLNMTPTFPYGAPTSQPAAVAPPTAEFNQPAAQGSTSAPASTESTTTFSPTTAADTAPATAPEATQPQSSTQQTQPASTSAPATQQ